ncbi:MAG: hypothetical protein FWE32_04870 [Oscillospiraceae bacterium]|nr:hypothetical protein [Oscillospiraceae bacterium]
MKNSKRELLLSALLTNPTVKQAAASVGIPETTAFNWLRDPDFSAEYKQRKRQAVNEASDYLQSRISAATRTIDDLMSDENIPPQVRLNAAKTILDTAYRVVAQAEIVERIEVLEAVSGDSGR